MSLKHIFTTLPWNQNDSWKLNQFLQDQTASPLSQSNKHTDRSDLQHFLQWFETIYLGKAQQYKHTQIKHYLLLEKAPMVIRYYETYLLEENKYTSREAASIVTRIRIYLEWLKKQ